jgi:HKD family nuclease
MARAELLFQGLTEQRHGEAINAICSDSASAIVSVAFALSEGVGCISDQLRRIGPEARVYIGIRNDITSGQALLALLKCGVSLYAVDTGSPSLLFHPKIYYFRSGDKAASLIGSANLTFSGLNNNIEASTLIHLLACDKEDRKYVDNLESIFESLIMRFPEHVIPIRSARTVIDLMKQGRVTDERARVVSSKKADPRTRSKDLLGRMPIPITRRPRIAVRKRARTIIYARSKDVSGEYALVWTSNGLTERDLNIPTGTNTNSTGSMLFKKGKNEDIDQRHYFYERVFNVLSWRSDAAHPHLMRSHADFCIIIKGADYGVYRLKLTHNNRTDSEAYKQRNSMTQIHWGVAKPLVAKRDLLGSTIRLYRQSDPGRRYVIEFID